MQANSINRLTIDWTMFRASVLGQSSSAQTIADTYPAIRAALGLLGDGHSSYRSAAGTVIFVPNRTCSASGAGTPTLPPTVGYVKVGSFSGSGSEATAFANNIQRVIMSADRDDLIGWIVDLRGNGGGNMWPMIAGVGPVLGEGVIGYFMTPPGRPAPGNTATEPRFKVASCGSALMAHTGCDASGRVWPCSQTTGLRAPGRPRSLRFVGAPTPDPSARRPAVSPPRTAVSP